MTTNCLIVGLLFLAVAQAFVKTGKEYEYDAEIHFGAGTYDYVPHASGGIFKFKLRMQAETSDSVNGEMSDVKYTEFVGARSDWDAHDLKFDAIDKKSQFGITLEKGLFKSLALPAGVSTSRRNMMKAFAAIFQLSFEHLSEGALAFKSTEQTIHGKCEVDQVVTSDTIIKSINLDRDCKDRQVRRVDDIRGFDCDMEHKDKAEGLVSTSTTIYSFEKEGDANKITKIVNSGAFVAQMFETKGVSHIAKINTTLTLVAVKDNPADIQAGTDVTNSLAYEFPDDEYKWNKDRDLKAAEPFQSNAATWLGDDQAKLKETFMKFLAKQKAILSNHENSKEAINEAHSFGVETLRLPLTAMDHATLTSIYDKLYADKSAEGITLSNIFTELLGSTGTTASAMTVLDLIKAKKFDNSRDTSRVLSSVPFHIRRPNTQLVGEYEALLGMDEESVVEMAIPLTFGHLVRITCERAGKRFSEEQRECFKGLGKKWTEHFLEKFKASTSRETRNLYIATIMNIRYGGHMKLLKPLIYGEVEGATSEERTMALYATLWDVAVHKKAMEFFFPLYADRKNEHEVRIGALDLIMKMKPSTTDIAKVVAVLATEKDYEVINMAFAMLESLATSISHCDHEASEAAGFFLKYLKQFSAYEMDWGFGVSKMYHRQFNQRKYGYGGSYNYYTIGSHDSTTPLSVVMTVSSYLSHSYKSNLLGVHVRTEGVAKGLIRKFKTMDPATWKTADLAAILTGEMGIKERPDQPVRAKVLVYFKGTVVICRTYDDSDSGTEGGKLGNIWKKMQSLGSEYSINHQRAITLGELMVEQPTDIGLPAIYWATATAMISLKADIKRGNKRGMMYREVDYHWGSFAQARSAMYMVMPSSNKYYAIIHDRIYKTHSPRKFVIGIKPLAKEFKLRVSRAAYDHPTMFMMHSRNKVKLGSTTFGVEPESLKKHCPSCEANVVVSAGEGAAKTRSIIDKECEKHGVRVKAEYFDCEMDVARRNVAGRLIAAFMPYNKSPRTAWTALTMGIRQIRAYLLYFPRAEKCGVVAKWSQSKANPVREIELSIVVKRGENGEKLFFRGSKFKLTATLKAIGDQTRAYRLTLTKESTPGDLMNKVKVKMDRAAVGALDIKPFVVCMAYEAKYPPFGKEMFNVELDKPLKMTGKAMLQYGEGTTCDGGQGEVTTTFEYSTTQEAREALKKKWYYKECMKLKESDTWKGRAGLPVDRSCYYMAEDATTARKYKYDIKFVKLTDRVKNAIAKIRSLVRTIMLRYYDIDAGDSSNIGPFMKIDATFKESDSLADVTVETSQGTKEFKDYALRFNWSKRLRNLKFSRLTVRLNKMGIIKPCVATSTYVRTMDNVTYPINGAPDCWTLVSGNCGPNPSYAVFTKKSGKSPLAMKAYIGGHAIEIDPSSNSAKVDGSPVDVTDSKEHKHKVNNVEILKITKWGSTYNIYSFLRVWIAFDGNFISVVPAPSVTGQHCGLCGNYNRNKYDEHTGKDGTTLIPGGYSKMTEEWKWKC